MRKRDERLAPNVFDEVLALLHAEDRSWGEYAHSGCVLQHPFVCRRGVLQMTQLPPYTYQTERRFTECPQHMSAQARAHGACEMHPLVAAHVLSAWRLGGEVLSQKVYQPKFRNYRWAPAYAAEWKVELQIVWRDMLVRDELLR